MGRNTLLLRPLQGRHIPPSIPGVVARSSLDPWLMAWMPPASVRASAKLEFRAWNHQVIRAKQVCSNLPSESTFNPSSLAILTPFQRCQRLKAHPAITRTSNLSIADEQNVWRHFMSSIYTLLITTLTLPLLVACSTSTTHRSDHQMASVISWADTKFSKHLATLLQRIERGDMCAWTEFAAHVNSGLDSERSETYSMACGELARRDPTIFLRRHLMGDPLASAVGTRAYGWVGVGGRNLMNWLHRSRLQLAADQRERQLICDYVEAVESILPSIDRRYR